MIKMKNKGRLFLFSFLIMFSLLLSFVNSQGNSFETATEMFSGNTYTGTITKEDGTHYYKITANPGQEIQMDVKIKYGGQSDTFTYAGIWGYLLGPDKEQIKWESASVSGTQEDSFSFLWLVDRETGSNNLFLKLDRTDKSGEAYYEVNVVINDRYDLNSGTDAPSSYENVIEVLPGDYKNCCWLATSTKNGNDNKDTYSTTLQAGENLTVTITPEVQNGEYGALSLSLVDSESRYPVASDYGISPGKILKASYFSEKTQKIYIVVETYGQGGPYSIKLEVQKPSQICAPGQTKCETSLYYDQIMKCDEFGVKWEVEENCVEGCVEERGSAKCKTSVPTTIDYGIPNIPGIDNVPGRSNFSDLFALDFLIFIGICLVIIFGSLYFLVFKKPKTVTRTAISPLQRPPTVEKPPLSPEMQRLVNYISSQVKLGFSEEQIRQALIQSGYNESQISAAFKIVIGYQ